MASIASQILACGAVRFGDSTLTWTFDADADGTLEAEGELLPARFTFTYETAGTFNATFKVSDGENQVTRNALINVTAATEQLPESVTFQGETQVPVGPTYEQVGGQQCLSFILDDSGIDCVLFKFEDDYAGRAWEAKSTGPQTYVDFWGVCDVEDGASLDKGTWASGTVPAGAGCVVLFANGPATGGVTLTFTVL